MSKSIDLLFVCTGNICRSPSAMLIAQNCAGHSAEYEELTISSAGTNTIDGVPITGEMALLLEDLGIDPYGFRSTMINNSIISDSKLIIVLDKTHKRYINRVSEGSRIYFLADLADGRYIEREITDPFGMDYAFYKKIFEEIKYSVYQFFANKLYGLL